MYQNSSAFGRRFPTVWSALLWVKVICTSIFSFFRIIAPQVWQHVRSRKWVQLEEKPTNVLEFLALKHAKDGTVSHTSLLWVMSLLLGYDSVAKVLLKIFLNKASNTESYLPLSTKRVYRFRFRLFSSDWIFSGPPCVFG